MSLFLAGFLACLALVACVVVSVLYSIRIRKDRLCGSCIGSGLTDEGERCGDCYGAGELDPA